MSILNANDAKNSLKGAAIQKSSFDVLVITTEIMFNVVLKHGTALNADGTPVPEAGESRRVRGVVDGVCDVRAHCRDLFMGDV